MLFRNEPGVIGESQRFSLLLCEIYWNWSEATSRSIAHFDRTASRDHPRSYSGAPSKLEYLYAHAHFIR